MDTHVNTRSTANTTEIQTEAQVDWVESLKPIHIQFTPENTQTGTQKTPERFTAKSVRSLIKEDM